MIHKDYWTLGTAVTVIGLQAVGLILAKLGMGEVGTEGSVGPWSATLVRMLFGGIGATVLFVMLLAGCFKESGAEDDPEQSSSLSRSKVFTCVLIGAIFGPVLGVWLGLVSIERIDAGVAATLMSLSPLFILPVARIVEREHISPRAVFGAVLAVIGVAVLVMSTSGSSPAVQDELAISVDRSSPGSTSNGASPAWNTLAIEPESSTSSSWTRSRQIPNGPPRTLPRSSRPPQRLERPS